MRHTSRATSNRLPRRHQAQGKLGECHLPHLKKRNLIVTTYTEVKMVLLELHEGSSKLRQVRMQDLPSELPLQQCSLWLEGPTPRFWSPLDAKIKR